MDRSKETEIVVSGRIERNQPRPLHSKKPLYLGVDVGSTSSDVVVLDEEGKIIISDYRRIRGRPLETVRSQLEKVLNQINPADIVLAAATGSAGRFVAELLDIDFINEVLAQGTAVSHLYRQFDRATVIEMGGQDSKLIFLVKEKGRVRIRDFALNTVCAAGTGSFLDQQAQRLGIDIEEEFGRMALQSKNPPRMAGRCSVFAKSDMIHLQQQATPNYDIIAGLCLALASNLKSDLGCGRKFVRPIIFTGGVAANAGVVRAIEQVFDLSQGELIVPDEHFFTGAIGAVLVAKSRSGYKNNGQLHINRIDDYLQRRGCALENAPRREPLSIPVLPPPKSRIYPLPSADDDPIEVYLGVDVGSISTNIAVIDRNKRVLAKAYLMTAGQPLEAVRQGMDIIGKKVAGKVKILGAATTGSGRYLTGDFIGADVVINEITAQAAGTAIVNPKVDTIFEIGGQDSKYISLKNGVVVDFEMNHACAAGTGSFLEEQAQRLGININEEFANLALASEAPIKLGERCTVFMESDLLNYQQQGAQTCDLVAGLSYSIVTNYLNRVVGRRKIGDNVCFQGGTAFNKAVWAAFEKVTGKPIMVPDHHEVTGAIGAAAIAAEHMEKNTGENAAKKQSTFKGFENLVSVDYTVESFPCEHCPNHCEIKKVQLSDSDPLYYGSRCDRYNLKKKTMKDNGFGAFEYRNEKLLEFSDLNDKKTVGSEKKTTIGIPMSLISWQLLPLFSRFFKALGFEVVLSSQTNKQTIRMGVETVTAQTCFPVKVGYGHIAELIDKKVDYIFLPSIVSMTASFPENECNQLCPYLQSFPYQIQTAFADKLGACKLLSVYMRFGEGQKLMQKSFRKLGKKLKASSRDVRKAVVIAVEAQKRFDISLVQKGSEILDKTRDSQRLFVLISRPYNGCDPAINLNLTKKLADLGVDIIPIDMLNLGSAKLGDKSLHKDVYWTYGQKILRAAEIIKDDPRLFAIYLSNFGCGPDSFLQTFFKDIMGHKPCLQLELDEHSADAGVITRLEAFLESLKNYKGDHQRQTAGQKKSAEKKTIDSDCTLYIPYMSDCSYGVAACFRGHGQLAEVMPIADEETLLQGRKFTTGKECLPCAITTGDMLRVIGKEDFDPKKVAFFMPGGSGPCRFGMYNCLHRLILNYAKAPDVPVIAPNQDGSFYKQLDTIIGGTSKTDFAKSVWTAVIGIDLLVKLLLRLRPFADDPDVVDEVYQWSLKRWVTAVEKQSGLSQLRDLTESIANDFDKIQLNHTLQKPRVGIVGEIYVRSHPFANNNIIARFEKLGAACELASLAEWIYYTNFTRNNMYRRKGQMQNFIKGRIRDFFQHRIERTLAGPLEKRFGKLAEGPIEHVIEEARPYIHHSFEGEAVLSIGKMIEYHKEGVAGVVNVMPFGCMPSTIVSTQTMRISTDLGNMPILNLSFDGQEDSTLTTRLEAFVEQARQRQGSLSSVSALLTTKS